MVANEIPVFDALLKRYVHYAVLESRISTRSNGNPFISFSGNLSEGWIDNDKLHSTFHRLFNKMPVMNLAIRHVGAPCDNGLCVFHIGRLVTLPERVRHARQSSARVSGEAKHTRHVDCH